MAFKNNFMPEETSFSFQLADLIKPIDAVHWEGTETLEFGLSSTDATR